MEIKQVIIIRKDLNMRKGKMIAQGAHSSLNSFLNSKNKNIVTEWLEIGATKIVVGVNSLEELEDIEAKALESNLTVAKVKDLGKTEFKEPTITALAIGPDWDSKIDPITKHLKLL